MSSYSDIVTGRATERKEIEILRCHNKKRFSSRKKALSARWEGAPFIYKCPVCNKWHLTSQGKKEEEE